MNKFTKGFAPLVAVIIIVVAAFLIGGGVAYYYVTKTQPVVQKQQSQNQQPQQQTQQTNPVQPTDQTAGYKTYANNKYGFEIKYPSNWYVDAQHSEDPTINIGKDIKGIGEIDFSNYPNATSYLFDRPKDILDVFLFIYKVDPDTNYDQFIYSYGGNGTKENITINGVKALRWTKVTTSSTPQVVSIDILIKIGGNMFDFGYSDNGNPISKNTKDIYEKIINSFKLSR